MSTFVLVHGAWHGGWCWAALERVLRDMGHDTHAPTLTGLGERSHLTTPDIDADTHVTDICNTIKWRELSDIVLVGHSYGGMVVTGVAGQMPERIRSMVYLDAMVPEESGVSLFSKANPERMAAFEKELEGGGFTLKPDLFDAWSDDPETIEWLKSKCTPHPVGCFRNGVTLTGRETEIAHKLYILAERNKPSAFWAEHEKVRGRGGWQTTKLPTKHDAMVEAPEVLARLLVDFDQRTRA
ncbi:alpha/beta hydrolase [Sulfitobacter mediterraneus]|uniref:alpha/beta hydrolase n=1 Tax=Sulfitobacter mediterraneus TaxID=83219 RepID=UPI0021A71659|nr:alpha/beta hydrolase family protein [Sulfitobacter mediterraneus]UWR13392.1 alpha/beta hydrolase [Sulfitobacter mediterraneus]